MANTTIARMVHEVKNENKDVMISMELQERAQSHRPERVLATTIFNDSIERARDLMDAFGHANFIPHTDYTTIDEIANFYGVETSYIKGLFTKYGIVYNKMEADVQRLASCKLIPVLRDFEDVCITLESPDRYHKSYMIARRSYGSCEKISVCAKGTPCFYSARVFLATAALMYFGSHIPKNSRASEVMEMLKRSGYYTISTQIAKQNSLKFAESNKDVKPAKEAVDVVAQAAPAGADTEAGVIENSTVTPNGSIVVSSEFLANLIKVVAKEAAREAAREAVRSVINDEFDVPSDFFKTDK